MSNDAWSIVVVLSVLTWILSGVMFLFRAFPQRGIFILKDSMPWGLSSLISFIIWIVGLLNA